MGKRSSRSRKGLSTAVGTAFFIIVVMISMSAIWAMSSFQTRYQEVTQQMNDWDTQRISENLNIRNVDNTTLVKTFGAHALNYNFSITVDNNGGVPVNIVRIYVYNQSRPANQSSKRLWIYNPINASAMQPRSGLNYSMVNTGEVAHVIAVNGTKFRGSFQYRIILTTDRGRQFSYSYPPPSGGGGGGGYAIILSDDQDNFQYAAGSMTSFKQAFVKPKGTDHTLYRILINNTTPRTILFHQNSTMLQIQGAVGQTTIRHVVSNLTQPPTASKPTATAFTSQTLGPFSWQYLYFASTTPGGNAWQTEPNNKDYYLVGYVLYFKYQGETEIRNISLPSITQELT